MYKNEVQYPANNLDISQREDRVPSTYYRQILRELYM